MKYTCFIISLLFSVLTYSREKVLKFPRSLYSSHENLKIEKVVFSDTATVLVCAYVGRIDSQLQWEPTTVLSDENCQVYPLKQVIWDKESEKMYISNTKRTDFRLIFAPMPDNTKVFDLIEGTNQRAFCLYGIHDVNTSLKIPRAKKSDEIQETMNDFLMDKRVSVIHGKIEGYSRDKGYGVATCLYRMFEHSDNMPGTCIYIHENGTFNMELFLDHPLWAEISTGANRPQIPFYISPGDTLGITVKGYDEKMMTLEYVTTNPNGCCKTLLQHNVPIIYSNWEKDGLTALAMTDDTFQSLTETCLNQNDRLCEYMAWKYGFSPLELRLAKNKCRFSVVLNHLVLANNIYRNRLGETCNVDNHSYPLYAVLNEIPLNDMRLMCLPYFIDLLSVINQIYPVSVVERHHTLTDDGSYLQRLHQTNCSQIAIFQNLVKTQELPWTLQCFFLNKMCSIPDAFRSDERNNIAVELSSCLTYPYLNNKLMRLDSVERKNTESTCRTFDRDSILSTSGGKYVHIVFLSSKDTDLKFCMSPSVENLLIDFKDNPDLQIVFIFNGYEYSEEQYDDVVSRVLPIDSHCIRLDFERYLEIQKSFCFTGSLKQITLDRKGDRLSIPLDMNHESGFRQKVRNILNPNGK